MRLLSGLRSRLCFGTVQEPGDLCRYALGNSSVLRTFGFQANHENSRLRLIIIGGGFAGAAAAREAHALGIHATLLEARPRLGGRARTRIIGSSSLIEDGPQFVGLNHHLVRFYAEVCGLNFVSLSEYDGPISPLLPAEGVIDPSSAKCAIANLLELAPSINADAALMDLEHPARSPRFADFDRITMAEWLKSCLPDGTARQAFEVQMVANHGVPLEQFSYAAFLLLVRAHGTEQYWDLTEEMVLREGTQVLVERMVAPLGDRVRKNCIVKHIELGSQSVTVYTEDGQCFVADDVILATPSSTWQQIAITPEAVGQSLLSNRPGFGRNIKFIFPLRRGVRFPAGLSSVAALQNGCLQLLWRTTEGQDSDFEVLTAFSGGPAADRLLAMGEAERLTVALDELRQIYPEFDSWLMPPAEQAIHSPRLIRWPEKHFTLGGYSCPNTGDIRRREIIEKAHPRLFVAGEHQAMKWAFMDGACESGIFAVAQLQSKYSPLRRKATELAA